MTKFLFPEDASFFELIFDKKAEKNLFTNIDSLKENKKYIEKSELTIHLEDFLEFLLDKNIQIDLPSQVQVKYFDFDRLEQLKYQLLHSDKSLVQYFSKKILNVDYLYPASTDLVSHTIYICNHFKFQETDKLHHLKDRFNGNSQQVLEYVFAHELGHLCLLERNKHNINNNQNDLFNQLARNIEEGFAESFAIQLLCIKYPNLLKETKEFEYLKSNSSKTEQTAIVKFIQQKAKEIHQLFNIYEYPEIYSRLPLKNQNGNIETDINQIYENCFNLAIKNNKQVILNKLNNSDLKIKKIDQKIIEQLHKSLNLKQSLTAEELISKVHDEFNNKGFIKIINNIKNFKKSSALNNSTNSNKPLI